MWFTQTEWGQPGIWLTDADFQPIIKKEELEGLPRQPEPEPQIKEETPEPNTLSFFPDDDDDNMAAREIKICIPTDFTGDCTKTSKFLSEVSLYLKVNSTIYDTDEKKIVFTLSFMNGGTTGAFAEMKGKGENLGSWADFKKSVEKTFSPIDDAGAACLKIKHLKQKKGALEDYVIKFQLLAVRSGIKEDVSLIEYFIDGLHPDIVWAIYAKDTILEKINDMIDAASKAQTVTDRANAIITMAQSLHNEKTEQTVKIEASTLSMDWLSYQEHTEHMKKGLCFVCHKPRHRASDHKDEWTPPSFPLPSTPPNSANQYQLKKTGAGAYAAIKAAMMDLDDEEKGKALKLLEESGFWSSSLLRHQVPLNSLSALYY